MQIKLLTAALMAATLAFPLAATAGNDKTSAKQASAQSGNDGGAEAMFAAMDKNGDGFISKEEAAGTPHAADFAALDKNGDGKLSRDEHFNAKEHVAARAKAGSTASSTDSATSSTDASGGKKTY